MAMSSYEVVRRAIEFQRPDRLPLCFQALGLCDVHGLGWNQIGTGDHRLRETLDEWGCLWARSEMSNMGQVQGHPLAEWATPEGGFILSDCRGQRSAIHWLPVLVPRPGRELARARC